MTQRLPFYFSIDFEDFHYDVCRAIGHKNPKNKENALYESYESISKLTKKYFNHKKMTFFSTGILARQFPDLIKKIFDDGNEIGCHYNFHDRISDSNRQEFSRNLDEAITSIESATGEKPIGFRAPFFGIESNNLWAYEEIAKRFKYDSSYRISSKYSDNVLYNHLSKLGLDMKEFFVYEKPLLGNFLKIRTGGTFLRIFSSRMIIKIMQEANSKGHMPLIYLHPYEFNNKKKFWIKWNDLYSLSYLHRTIFWLRQMQWSHLGHSSVESKISHISKFFDHQGPMRQIILKNK